MSRKQARFAKVAMIAILMVWLAWIMSMPGSMDRGVWISQLLNSLWE